MPEFIDWFPSSLHGPLNVRDFGAFGDGAGHVLSGTYATLGEAQVDYPSATSLSDTADWAAITECFKQAFSHETSPGVWESNGTTYWLNKPVFFPAGLYTIYKPLHWNNIQGGWIFGSGGGTTITNELGTPGISSCVLTNGFAYCRVENITFATVGGESASKGFDVNSDNGVATTVAANACTFHSCHFSAPGGCGIAFGDPATFPGAGYMSSEMHFYHCTMNNCAVGIYIANWNALNYSFVGCGGIGNGVWLQVSAGGAVTVINGSLANNGWDIKVGAGQAAIISTRSESIKFVDAAGPTHITSCTHLGYGGQSVFCQALNPVYAFGCYTWAGRLIGGGNVHIEECTFNNALYPILTVTNSDGLIRITHETLPNAQEMWLDGDEVKIQGVTGTGAASINGVWIVTKINATTIDLVGSVFGGTYTGLGVGGSAQLGPGPRFHLRNNIEPYLGYPPDLQAAGRPNRRLIESKTKNFALIWIDSGTVIDNYRATGPITGRLPDLNTGSGGRRGATYEFVVLEAQMLTIDVNPAYNPAFTFGKPRIIEAGGPANGGTRIKFNQVGASLELYLSDHVPIQTGATADDTQSGQRWLVRKKSGTWTLSDPGGVLP